MPSSRTGAISPQARNAQFDNTNALARIAGLATACGATGAGGPLSAEERTLVDGAPKISPSEARSVRDAIIDGRDPLGDAFLAARSSERRRRDGAFYTGETIRRSMLQWAMQFQPGRLVDPGCGSGRFTAGALRSNPNLHVVAVDRDPLATLMTRAVAAVLCAPNVRVICGDYLAASIERYPGRTAFVGNPPYVRHHDLSQEFKREAKTLALGAGLRASGLAGLHAWFFVATSVRHGVRGDVGAYVTSAQWLDAAYGSVVRELLSGPMGGRSLLAFDVTSSPFDAMTTAAIATFEIGRNVESMLLRSLSLPDEEFELERDGNAVGRDRLRDCERWSTLFHGGERPEHEATIGSAFRVSRGQVTGDNAFFVMTRERARELGIAEFCVPVIAAAREVLASGGAVGDAPERRVALRIPRTLEVAGVPALARYIAQGEARGVHRGYIASRRTPWYAVSYPQPPIVATYMARRAPCFAHNPDGLGVLNVVHGMYPHEAMSEASLRDTVDRLNASAVRFAGRGRTYHGGLRKFEPSDLAAVPLDTAPGVTKPA